MRRKGKGYLSWGARIEMLLLRLVVLAFVVFFVVQAVFVGNPVQRIVNVFEGVEGTGFEKELREPAREALGTNSGEGEVTLALMDYSSLQKAKILVNGQVRGDFLHRYVSVNLREGDILEIDGSFYTHPFKVKVVKIEPTMKGLEEGQQFTVREEILTLGEVRFQKLGKPEQLNPTLTPP